MSLTIGDVKVGHLYYCDFIERENIIMVTNKINGWINFYYLTHPYDEMYEQETRIYLYEVNNGKAHH